MIPAITFEDIIKVIGNEILEQTNIRRDMFKNVTGVRGSSLAKKLSDTELGSINLNDTFIVFELNEDEDTSNNVTINESDDTVNLFTAYNFFLKIYGNKCHTVAQQILTRLRSRLVSFRLRGRGVLLTEVTFPVNQNEFINNTLWPRCDLTIKLRVRHNISLVKPEGEFSDENCQIIIDEI